MNLTKALSLLGQISAALRCIHQHGLVHRDVKPANIMLSQSHDVAKLIDLGTIRGLDDASQLTEIGTPLYAAPEQYLPSRTQGARLTAATDVYALAKTAYAMLTGAEPRGFNQRQIVSLPREVANEAWAMPVLRVFMKATSDDPATRHRSVAEFYADLCDAIEVTSYTVRETVAPRGNFRFVVKLARPAATPSRAMRISAWLAFAFARLRLVIANLYHRCRRRESDAVRIAPRGWYRGAAAIVLLCLLTLAFVPGILHFSRRMLTPPAVEAEQNQEAPDERLQATTDINIRERPNPKARRVGLVARDSIVRLLKRNQSQKWCQIEVVTHGRPKTDPTFLDRGWVSCRYLAGVSAISMNPDLT
jgi:serine/threonine protein kinase